MIQKSTLTKVPGFILAFLCFVCVFASSVQAQVYTNGPISTGATNSGGIAAPTGYTWSELQGNFNTIGNNGNFAVGNSLIDNFTVTGSWTLTSLRLFGYSTGYASTTVSPFDEVYVRIYNANPMTGTPTPIFGDLTTNRFTSSSIANIYRITNGATATDRRVWAIDANINTTLPAGNYWIEFSIGSIASVAAHFTPPVTVVGVPTPAGANGMTR